MLFLQLFVSKINSNSLFRTHVVRLYDLMSYDYRSHVVRLYTPMSYDYRVPCRTTWELINVSLQSQKNITHWFSAHFFFAHIFNIHTQIRISWKYRNLSKENIKRKSQTLMAASTLFVHAVPPKEGFVSASFNSHCVAFLSLHINVLFIMVWQYVIHFCTTTYKPNQTFWLFQ